MLKWQRSYKCFIQSNDQTLTIEYPLTAKFNVTRNNGAAANTMDLELYNLSETTRNAIFQDRFNPKEFKKIILMAGYDQLFEIFIGNIFHAYSERQGPNIITKIFAQDGGFDLQNTMSSFNVAKGTSNIDILNRLIADFTHITKGDIGDVQGSIKRGAVFDESTFRLIDRWTGGDAYIDCGKLHVLSNKEAVTGEVYLITSETGLLNTPKREETFLSVDLVFEPRLKMCQVVEVQSSIQKKFNGQYKIIGIQHRGTISGAEAGDAVTTVNLLIGTKVFNNLYEQNVNNITTNKPNAKAPQHFKIVDNTKKDLHNKSYSAINSKSWTAPVNSGVVSSKYGSPRPNGRVHAGIDFAVPNGTSVTPARNGRVIFAGTQQGYGKVVIVDHGHGLTTKYAHLSKILVSKGQYITTQNKLGLSGNTGYSTGPHLHFEINKNGKSINPKDVI